MSQRDHFVFLFTVGGNALKFFEPGLEFKQRRKLLRCWSLVISILNSKGKASAEYVLNSKEGIGPLGGISGPASTSVGFYSTTVSCTTC